MKITLKDFFVENDETYYVLLIEMKSLEWNARKRFSQFYQLYKELRRLYPELEIPHLEKQILGFKQEKRNEQLNAFLRFIGANFTLEHSGPFQKFIFCDIFVDNIDDFLAITKHKQKEYVRNFLAEPKISNMKNYITSLENQMIEVIDHKKYILGQMNIMATKLNGLDEENGSMRLSISSLTAENKELRRIYENNKDTICELTETISTLNGELDSNLNQVRELECLNKQFRQKCDKLEEEKRHEYNQRIYLEKRNQQLANEAISLKHFAPSAPPMPDDVFYSKSYSESLSKPPSLK